MTRKCGERGKVRFATEAGAVLWAARAADRFGDAQEPYPCDGCGGWHTRDLRKRKARADRFYARQSGATDPEARKRRKARKRANYRANLKRRRSGPGVEDGGCGGLCIGGKGPSGGHGA
ncbi:hypothetical protein DER29_0467 [Micromonospora sp. M71_S20]|nr:hypothetical protein DER29_0467 [Micromonospora sp. M71_S20]